MTKELEKSIDIETKRKKFQGTKYKTKCCDEVIYSKYSGHFAFCKCREVAIDQTEHYSRVVGNINMLEILEN